MTDTRMYGELGFVAVAESLVLHCPKCGHSYFLERNAIGLERIKVKGKVRILVVFDAQKDRSCPNCRRNKRGRTQGRRKPLSRGKT